MMDKLPVPNEVELKPFNKVKYVDRVYQSGLNNKKYNLSEIEFSKFITETYDHWLLHRKQITIKDLKKL